mmetsp:Transcript_77185/g.120650  ORF Transcript_77185/g.120650 Transcript_77185/m.120650 type:complete len:863 (+) Transcript_77185:74-2662(+)
MKVHLEALPGEVVPEDTFVSVRIGDLRKLSHFTASRSYNFPADTLKDSRNKCGFIEVYKRVGTTIIDFEDLDGAGAQDMDIPCNQPGFEKLGLQVTVGEEKGAQPMKNDNSRQDQRARYRHRMEAVKQYMAYHNIEQLVSDSVGHLLKDKPEDPRLMLSNYVNKHASLAPLEEESELYRKSKLTKKRDKDIMKKSGSGMILPKLVTDTASANLLPPRDFSDPLASRAKQTAPRTQAQPREASLQDCTTKPLALTPQSLLMQEKSLSAVDEKTNLKNGWRFLPSVGSWLSARSTSAFHIAKGIASSDSSVPVVSEEVRQQETKEASFEKFQDKGVGIETTERFEVDEPDQEPDAEFDRKTVDHAYNYETSADSRLGSRPDTPSDVGGDPGADLGDDTECKKPQRFLHRPSVGSWLNIRARHPAVQQGSQPDQIALQVEKVEKAEEMRKVAETAALEQARQANLAMLEAEELSRKAEEARLAAEFAMSDLDWAHQAAAKVEESRLAREALLKTAHSHLYTIQEEVDFATNSKEVVESTRQDTYAACNITLESKDTSQLGGRMRQSEKDLLEEADRLDAQAVDAKDPKAAEARLLRLCAQASKPRDTKSAEDRLFRLTAEATGQAVAKDESTPSLQCHQADSDESVRPMSMDIDTDSQSDVTTSGRSLANAMVAGSLEQAAIDAWPKSVSSASNVGEQDAQSEMSLDVGPPIRVSHSPCSSSLASACMFGAISALDDLRPEAYECSVASMSTLPDKESDMFAMPRPTSQASRVSVSTAGDLQVLSEREKRLQNEVMQDSAQPDPIQLLHLQTIQELERERDEALLMATYMPQDEREEVEVKVEMLDLALQEARAEYASTYTIGEV